MKTTGVISPATTFHHRSSLVATSHCLPPSTRSVPLRNNNFQCKAVSKSRIQEYYDALHKNGAPLINWDDDNVGDHIDTNKILYPNDEIKWLIETIKAMFGSMNDGEISVSAYDTAWVALVQDVNCGDSPQFPSSLEWIANNQLPDGSWGDRVLFLAHDRIINTLACVITLTSWNVHSSKCEKGVKFLKENLRKLEDENEEHMPIGFEVALPSLIDIARKLKIEIPNDTPALKEIYARQKLKLTTIPMEVVHKVPTSLLYSLEGMADLEWEKLLKLQCKDGSFLFSPSSTAFALMNTKDEKCLQYLTNIVTKFNGGVPNVYPVDLFEHIWVVDRLQRLDVFRQFEKDGQFVCFAGQSTQAVTGMFDLYRASQVLFPGEKILEDAKKFSYDYLKKKQLKNELLDKWIIAKDLPGEVGYAINIPWYASLPRLETRYYLEQYGGEDDVWIGKTLYRWYHKSGIEKFETSNITSLLVSYYLAVASIFEPERSAERIAWTKTAILVQTISSYFDSSQLSNEDRTAFLDEFRNRSSFKQHFKNEPWYEVMVALQKTLHELALDALMAHSQNIHPQLHHAWEMWLTKWHDGVEVTGDAELMVRTINMTAGRWVSKELIIHPQYQRLSTVTDNICLELSKFHNSKENCTTCDNNGARNYTMIDLEMQELVQLVLCDSPDGLEQDLKQTFLSVARTMYYQACCDPKTINAHISKVFEIVI
ncbi:ent-copalyl diphosphate synthase, chloroplastic isoform X2 [Helianthus annuus]|uniref:ent-copalyl diphosphate synthase, chloroplastic isoform X2 n=1 Tax=Helianthus annuus TaxID=4232 RepID=UPI001652E3AF|nr:ent-copalyl diphosphate synthase, chloroplastic isoform X2 [Helianthus annuus]